MLAPFIVCHVPDQLERVRAALDDATETADRDVREQLASIDEGLMELLGGDKTQRTTPHEDRLRELIEKLDGLRDEADGETSAHVGEARELLDDYRERRYTK